LSRVSAAGVSESSAAFEYKVKANQINFIAVLPAAGWFTMV